MKKILITTISTILLVSFMACSCDWGQFDDIENLVRRVDELERENIDLRERIKTLEIKFNAQNGEFYTLMESFNNDALNKNDIMSISYYLTGSVYIIPTDNENFENSENWEKLDFVPENTIIELDEIIEESIKWAYYYNNPEAFKDNDREYGIEILNIKFLGKYNQCYAVVIESELGGYGTAETTVNIGGVVWKHSGTPVSVFKINI